MNKSAIFVMGTSLAFCFCSENLIAQPISRLPDGRTKAVVPDKILFSNNHYSLRTREIVVDDESRVGLMRPESIPVFSKDADGVERQGVQLVARDESIFPRTKAPYYVYWDSVSNSFQLVESELVRQACSGGPASPRERMYFGEPGSGIPVVYYNEDSQVPKPAARTSWTLNINLDTTGAPVGQISNINAAVARVQARMQDMLADNGGHRQRFCILCERYDKAEPTRLDGTDFSF